MAGILVLGIDPGTRESAFYFLDAGQPTPKHGVESNDVVLALLSDLSKLIHIGIEKRQEGVSPFVRLAIESTQNYGAVVGKDVRETIEWTGRFKQRAFDSGFSEENVRTYARPSIKAFLVGTAASKDSDVKAALEQRYGLSRKGQPLEGVTKHQWAALAVATFCWDGLLLGNKW